MKHMYKICPFCHQLLYFNLWVFSKEHFIECHDEIPCLGSLTDKWDDYEPRE